MTLWLAFKVGLGFRPELIMVTHTHACVRTHTHIHGIGDFIQGRIKSASFLFVSYGIFMILGCGI